MAPAKSSKRLGTRAKEKEKKQKIILAVACVLLLGVLVIEGPSMLKRLNGKAPANEAHATTTSTTAATPMAAPATAPALPGSTAAPEQAAVVSGGIGIAETSSEPVADDGQLISFDRFRTKDPFVPQVNAPCTADSGTPCDTAPPTRATPTARTPVNASPTTPATTTTQSQPPAPASATATPTAPTTTASPAPPAAALIAVNGRTESVAVKSAFPETDPTFTLTALTPKAAKIGLVGGAYSSGSPTITLKRGKTVTLMNTADGTRYTLKYVSAS